MSYWEDLKTSGTKTIVIDEGITEIPDYALSGLVAEEVVLPKSLVSIGNEAFRKSHIKRIIIPNGVKYIQSKAFEMCKELKEVEFPNSLITIEGCAFNDCDKLTRITIPHVNKIKNNAFKGCQSLKKVEIMSGLKKLENGGFSYCYKLQEVSLCDGVDTIGEYAFVATAIKSICVPDSVKKIGEGAFMSCGQLEKIHLPENLTKISKRLFSGCDQLKSLSIPKKVKRIEQEAFYSCTSFEKLTVLGDVVIEANAFDYPSPLKELSVSEKSLLTIYEADWINDPLEELKVEDLRITGEFLDMFKKNAFVKPTFYHIDKNCFLNTSLESLADSLLAIQENIDYAASFIKAMAEYLQMSKDY